MDTAKKKIVIGQIVLNVMIGILLILAFFGLSTENKKTENGARAQINQVCVTGEITECTTFSSKSLVEINLSNDTGSDEVTLYIRQIERQ